MERLVERLDDAKRSLVTLTEALALEAPSPLERDGAIQRFEYTFEALWKLGQRYLYVVEALQANSPNVVFRNLALAGLLSQEETSLALAMAQDRNLTVHTYLEPLAVRIHGNLPLYRGLMEVLLERIEAALARS